MEEAFAFKKDQNAVIVTVLRTVAVIELKRAHVAIAHNFDVPHRLWDLSSVGFNYSQAEMEEIAELGKKLMVGTGKVGFLVSDDDSYDNLLKYKELRAARLKQEVEIFRKRKEAMAWLQN